MNPAAIPASVIGWLDFCVGLFLGKSVGGSALVFDGEAVELDLADGLFRAAVQADVIVGSGWSAFHDDGLKISPALLASPLHEVAERGFLGGKWLSGWLSGELLAVGHGGEVCGCCHFRGDSEHVSEAHDSHLGCFGELAVFDFYRVHGYINTRLSGIACSGLSGKYRGEENSRAL